MTEFSLKSTEIQRKRFLIHALVRANNAGKRPLPVDQMIPSLLGFQALISPSVGKSSLTSL